MWPFNKKFESFYPNMLCAQVAIKLYRSGENVKDVKDYSQMDKRQTKGDPKI